jgi:acyl-CoA synthetase (AMP-forming)/AMP-acid ligase II
VGSLPDDLLGNKLVLVLEFTAAIDYSKKTFESILTRYEIPKMLTILPTFERTTSGKINRKATLSKILTNDWKPIL